MAVTILLTQTASAFHFICSRYRKHKVEEQCTPHSIRESVLDEIILEEIRRITYYARTKTKDFAEFINQKTSAESRKELSAKSAELGRLKKERPLTEEEAAEQAALRAEYLAEVRRQLKGDKA